MQYYGSTQISFYHDQFITKLRGKIAGEISFVPQDHIVLFLSYRKLDNPFWKKKKRVNQFYENLQHIWGLNNIS